MTFGERPISAQEYEIGLDRRVLEPELQERYEKKHQPPKTSDYVFVALLEDGAGLVRKLSRIEGIHAARERSGLFVVQFALLGPEFEERQATSVSHFAHGLYEGEVKEGTSLRVTAGEVTDARVTSGYFLDRPPRAEEEDSLMVDVMEARRRDGGDPII